MHRLLLGALLFCISGPLYAQEDAGAEPFTQKPTLRAPKGTPGDVLSDAQWSRVDESVQRALVFLASQQDPDGSFPTMSHAQPGVTSLCVLAFMAHGHNPGEGEYGERLDRAIDYIIQCQKPNGLIVLEGYEGKRISRNVEHLQGVAGTYCHAISGLTLSEHYGMSPPKQAATIEAVIENAVKATLTMQRWPKNFEYDRGGWRYIHRYDETDSDLSVTGWQLMFLRSARNAGFSVPKESIDDAVAYIRRSFDPSRGTFRYRVNRGDDRSRGMTGAGILALGHAGFHHSPEAQSAGRELLQYSFEVYNDTNPFPRRDRYHYSLFMCCQGAYQLGSPYWEQFFPRTVNAVIQNQSSDGSWDAESFHRDRRYGNAYTTSLVLLALGAPNQFLPVFQR